MSDLESLKFNNIIRIKKYDKDGNLKQEYEQKNLFVFTGKTVVLNALGDMQSGITYGAVGTGSTAATVSDTTLATELNRNQAYYSIAGYTATFSTFFGTSEAIGTITEVGFFGGNSATSVADTGSLFNRVVLASSISKTSDDVLTIELDITVS